EMVRRVEVDVEPGQGVPVARAVQEVVDDRSRPVDAVVIAPPIEKPASLPADNFFNPNNPSEQARIVLERVFESDREVFRLRQPIGYWDAEVGAVIVPDNLGSFDTDLTSVTRFFTWLVSTTGVHLPAALVHDGLIPGRTAGSSYVASQEIDRVTADRIFRSGMQDLGTSWLLRWLIWAAVATATMVSGPDAVWRKRLAVGVTVAVVVVLGVLATIDLFDCREILPWMSDRPLWLEVVNGAVCAVVIPALLSVLWWEQWRAGILIGVALALMLHVTVALVLVYAVFAAADAAFSRDPRRMLRWGAVAVGLTATLVLIGVWAC
ncbi:MAG: DUF1353 domain-containing protein, partial [Micromonosporaceae bacterium]